METVFLAMWALIISLVTLIVGIYNLRKLEKKQKNINDSVNENLRELKKITKELLK